MSAKKALLSSKLKRHVDAGAKSNSEKSKKYIEGFLKNGELIEVDPNDVGVWEYANRQQEEMGNISELAQSIKDYGQVQPALIVRADNTFVPSEEYKSSKYVVIAGRRRREACLAFNLKYLARLQNNLDIETALEIQRVENSEREDVSDFSEGISYYNAIKDGKASHKKLFEKSNASKSKITHLLSYGALQEEFPDLYEKIKDFTKVSSRLAYDVLSYARKGRADDLTKYADLISNGRIGSRKLAKVMDQEVEDNSVKVFNYKNVKYMTLSGSRLTISLSKIKDATILDKIDLLIKESLDDSNANGGRCD